MTEAVAAIAGSRRRAGDFAAAGAGAVGRGAGARANLARRRLAPLFDFSNSAAGGPSIIPVPGLPPLRRPPGRRRRPSRHRAPPYQGRKLPAGKEEHNRSDKHVCARVEHFARMKGWKPCLTQLSRRPAEVAEHHLARLAARPRKQAVGPARRYATDRSTATRAGGGARPLPAERGRTVASADVRLRLLRAHRARARRACRQAQPGERGPTEASRRQACRPEPRREPPPTCPTPRGGPAEPEDGALPDAVPPQAACAARPDAVPVFRRTLWVRSWARRVSSRAANAARRLAVRRNLPRHLQCLMNNAPAMQRAAGRALAQRFVSPCTGNR